MSTVGNETPLGAPTSGDPILDASTASPPTTEDGAETQTISKDKHGVSNDTLPHTSIPRVGDVGIDTINANDEPKRSKETEQKSTNGDGTESEDDGGFLRVREKVRDLKRQAKEILHLQALKAEWLELQDMLGGQIDPANPDRQEPTMRERSDILLGMELGGRYREEGFDHLYTYMPDEYRRKVTWRPYDEIESSARKTAQKVRPSLFLEGYVHPQPDGDDPSFEFTRRRLRARYSYEREMEYLYAIQDRYDAMRAETLERERQEGEAKTREKEEEEARARPREYIEDTSPRKRDLEESEPQEIYAEPGLNRVEWATFKFIRRKDLKSSFVLDVLIGEPVISYDVMGIPIHQRQAEKKEDISKDRKAATKQLARGQAPLPERIRINSRPLIQVLGKIHGEPIDDTDGSVVMTRPFKALSYYDDKIRHWYDMLVNKYRVHAGDLETEEDAKSTAESEVQSEDGWDDLANPLATLQHLTCLLEFIDTDIKERLDYLASEHCQQVTFSDLWYLFKPGDEVIGKRDRQAYRILSITSPRHKGVLPWGAFYNRFQDESKEKPMWIHCTYVDFDGKRLGPVSEEFEIEAFDGERSIASLPLHPFRFSKTPGLRDTLVQRGKKFLAMVAVKHMHCTGATLDTRDEVDSQVVIDFAEALSVPANREWRPNIEELLGEVPENEADEGCTAECCRRVAVHDDSYVDGKRNEAFMASLNPQDRSRLPSVAVYPRTLEDLGREENTLTDDELLIMSYRAFGFVLRTRKWAPLDLTDLVDVRPEEDKMGLKRETPFDKLVLPRGHKEIVQSLIAQHFRDKESGGGRNEQVDFVRGKGKGLILLLHGAPGVGKTTTAECVADLFQKPLFQITCGGLSSFRDCVSINPADLTTSGDLGSTAKDVEATLETNFSLANRWGCILLLDEADVFLAARSPTDFKRNGLVAVFLRVLEYYAGILFLTTNRVGDFDEAFASRIHISLYYPPLTLDSTIKVFQLNLAMLSDRFHRKSRKLSIDEQILEFATQHYLKNEKARWNGRQIRNACQTALALAEFEAQGAKHDAVVDASAEVRLQQKHFKTVTDAYLEFTHYLKDIFGIYADERAQEQNLRAQSKVSETINPLFSYNNNGTHPGSSGQPVLTVQRGYPSGPMSQSPGPYYTQYYQPTYQQQVPPGFAYGGPGNPQNMPQQAQQAWPGINLSSPGSLDAMGPPQQGSFPAGPATFTRGQTSVFPPDHQKPPDANPESGSI